MSRAGHSVSAYLMHMLMWSVGSVWLLMAAGSAWQARAEINEGMDGTLIDTAHRLLDLAMHDLEPALDAAAGRTPMPLVQRAAPDEHHEDQVYQVVDAAGRVLLRSEDAPESMLPVPLAAGFTDLADWRVYAGRHAEHPVYILVGDSLAHRREAQFETTLWLLVPMIAVLPLLALLIRFVTRRGLEPLQQVAGQIRRRGGEDLSPIATGSLPLELQIITTSTNHLLQRLGEALKTERALAANAAHELRTPLATTRLRLHTLLGMNLEPAAKAEAGQALASLIQLERRAEKLLQMSRAESGAALASDPVNLGELAGVVAQEFWSDAALLGRVHLQVPADEDVIAVGDFDALAIALRNLVENALRYGAPGDVDIVVEPPAVLRVRDSGPGVPAEALELIRHRHVKHANDSPGYGVGLAIVGTIVERHGGRLVLASPPQGRAHGFEAVLVLTGLCASAQTHAADGAETGSLPSRTRS